MKRRRCFRMHVILGSRRGSLWTNVGSRTSSVRVCQTFRIIIKKNAFFFLAVSGIGHKIKSVNNPDHRVELVKEYVIKNFPSHSLLDYGLGVEKVTTAKKDTVKSLSKNGWIKWRGLLFFFFCQLILNVDGCIAVCFVDLLRDSGAFTPEEADEYIKVRLSLSLTRS
jgi:ATP citrate (pro-S)-lyase